MEIDFNQLRLNFQVDYNLIAKEIESAAQDGYLDFYRMDRFLLRLHNDIVFLMGCNGEGIDDLSDKIDLHKFDSDLYL